MEFCSPNLILLWKSVAWTSRFLVTRVTRLHWSHLSLEQSPMYTTDWCSEVRTELEGPGCSPGVWLYGVAHVQSTVFMQADFSKPRCAQGGVLLVSLFDVCVYKCMVGPFWVKLLPCQGTSSTVPGERFSFFREHYASCPPHSLDIGLEVMWWHSLACLGFSY